jgi:carbon starvation protein CstA
MSAILTFALWSLQSVRAAGYSSTLSQMIDVAIGRAQRTLALIRAGLYSCVIAAVFGLVGTAIRAHFGRPPSMSPSVDLAILALIALVLFLCHRQLRVELGKYRALRQALAVDGEA